MDISGDEAFDKLLDRIETLSANWRHEREQAGELKFKLQELTTQHGALTKDRDRLAEALRARNDEIGKLRSQIAKYEGVPVSPIAPDPPDKPETPKHWPNPADISF